MKSRRRGLARRLVRWFGPAALGLWSRSWRITILGEDNLESDYGKRGRFVSLWHGRMILPLRYYARRGWHVLVSRSGDGDVSQELLRGFGYEVIRGSSSRGGARALRDMLAVLDAGSVLIITPDGPRGPRHSMNQGLAWMARATGYPVIPCGLVCDRAWRSRSWDRFTIPKFRARVVFVYGSPIWIGRSANEEDLRQATERIGFEMTCAEQRGFELLGLEPDW